MFTSPGSIAFSLFGLDIYFYGILMAFAVAVSLSISYKFAGKILEKEFILDIAPLLLLYGILGARLYYCVTNYSYFSNHLLEIFAMRNGGLSIHGALIGGMVYLFYYSNKHKISFLKLTDILAIGLPLAQAIARWGNFFNSEAFGTPCNLAWKLYIPIENRPAEYLNYSYFHPTFLYESILDILIFTILIYLFNKNFKTGKITFIYLILYSVARIIIELFRVDATLFIYGIPLPIIVSIGIIIIISFIGLKYLK